MSPVQHQSLGSTAVHEKVDTGPTLTVELAPSCPPVSVLIVSTNELSHLKACLRSVTQQTYPNYEVIVIDNSSTDGSVECLAVNEGEDVSVLSEGRAGAAARCYPDRCEDVSGARGARFPVSGQNPLARFSRVRLRDGLFCTVETRAVGCFSQGRGFVLRGDEAGPRFRSLR
jgi:cellulose synthase/poly-beta-1,6-N-acetylglucosamine synthase-like glycosyltransferase